MFIRTFSTHGHKSKIVLRDNTEERLQGTCFRGLSYRKAGNFVLWTSAADMFSLDHEDSLLAAFATQTRSMRQGRHSFTIEHSALVGWESTDEILNYPADALELFNPNNHTNARRVKPDRRDLLAPRTTLVTFAVEMKYEAKVPTFVIHSIYPGVNIGRLHGDLTEKGRVFFDWKHPGA